MRRASDRHYAKSFVIMIVGLLLAAGGANRFGSQKLVAPYRGQPLVSHAARRLRAATDATIAVLGSDADAVATVLMDCDVSAIVNDYWRDGLSTSLRIGVRALPPDAEAIVVALGDQPELDSDAVRLLVEQWRATGMPIVTTRYRGVRAPPVLLAREVFGDVEALRGDNGAKPLMDRMPERVAFVDVDADIPFDVDTPADLDRESR
jgi:molybdenum cofactor cytidylyltransferase